MRSYTVKSGDTLSNIAKALLGDVNRWRDLAALNGIANANLIRPGQVLQIPEGFETVTVPALPTEPVTFITPTIEAPHIVGLDPTAEAEILEEITVTGRRIDYALLAAILGAAWLLFKGVKSGRKRRRR